MVEYCKYCAEKGIKHDFQDKTYGDFKRVKNPKLKNGTAKCTVCGQTNSK